MYLCLLFLLDPDVDLGQRVTERQRKKMFSLIYIDLNENVICVPWSQGIYLKTSQQKHIKAYPVFPPETMPLILSCHYLCTIIRIYTQTMVCSVYSVCVKSKKPKQVTIILCVYEAQESEGEIEMKLSK